MWQLQYSKEDDEWSVSEFFKKELAGPEELGYLFLEDALREAQKRNNPSSNGWFWSEGDDRE